MSDVFVSYAHADRDWVRPFAEVLSSQGWTVWWDREIPIGGTFQQVIEEALAQARCVSVIWSRESVKSDWVREEAEEARERRVLLPVIKDKVGVPFGFKSIQAADLVNWRGGHDHVGMQALIRSIEKFVGAPRELPATEAVRLIRKFCDHRKIEIGEITSSDASSFGTKCFRAKAKDGMGIVFCHASGSHIGEVYYVRKGIALYYDRYVGGPASPLGLPISNEELVDSTTFPTSYFEGGYVDWSPKTSKARAMRVTDGGEEQQLGKSIRL